MLNEREAVLVDDAVVEFKPGAASVVAALKSRFGCRCIQGLWIVGVGDQAAHRPLVHERCRLQIPVRTVRTRLEKSCHGPHEQASICGHARDSNLPYCRLRGYLVETATKLHTIVLANRSYRMATFFRALGFTCVSLFLVACGGASAPAAQQPA